MQVRLESLARDDLESPCLVGLADPETGRLTGTHAELASATVLAPPWAQ